MPAALADAPVTGDSPERRAEHHTPPGGMVDMMLQLGGVERESRFKPDKK
jgi:hypothetical protein